MGIQKIAKEIIFEELEENTHPEKVEDVIFWALEYYANNFPEPTFGKVIASAIVGRIKDAEAESEALNN